MWKKFSGFVADDEGAVTVDWVVLTAGVVILAIGAITALDVAIKDLVDDITLELVWSNISNGM